MILENLPQAVPGPTTCRATGYPDDLVSFEAEQEPR